MLDVSLDGAQRHDEAFGDLAVRQPRGHQCEHVDLPAGDPEGLQVRWLHRPDFDMVEEFLFTLERFGIRPPELLTGELDAALRPARTSA